MTSPASELRYADRYRVLRRLGSGGMATVFLAEDERLGRQVAVKRLHADSPEEMAQRFGREARIGASMNHPNLVAVYDTLTDPEGVLIVMEYVDGPTLANALKQGPLARDRAVALLSQTAAALDYAHRLGIVHRDVKPANILLAEGGEAKLADLGIALAAERATQITRTGTVLGTPSYMAPEQLEGRDVGPTTDVYALAAVAFEALAGRKARTGDTPLAIAHSIATEPAPDVREVWPDAPAGVSEALCQGMAFEPADRPGSAGELAQRLRAALGGGEAATAATRRGGQGAAGAAAAGAAAAAAAAAGAGADRAEGADDLGAGEATAAPAGAPTGAGSESPSAEPAPRAGSESPSAEPAPRADAAPQPASAARPAASPVARRRARPAWLAPAALLLLVVAATVAAIIALGGGGGTNEQIGSGEGSPEGSGATGGSDQPAAGGEAPGTSALDPAQTVTSFYERSAADDYEGAWALAGPGFRSQLGGFESFRQSQSTLESIDFEQAAATSQSADAAQVAIRSVATHVDGVDRCQGTLDLARGGATGWLIDGAAITCPQTTRGAGSSDASPDESGSGQAPPSADTSSESSGQRSESSEAASRGNANGRSAAQGVRRRAGRAADGADGADGGDD